MDNAGAHALHHRRASVCPRTKTRQAGLAWQATTSLCVTEDTTENLFSEIALSKKFFFLFPFLVTTRCFVQVAGSYRTMALLSWCGVSARRYFLGAARHSEMCSKLFHYRCNTNKIHAHQSQLLKCYFYSHPIRKYEYTINLQQR